MATPLVLAAVIASSVLCKPVSASPARVGSDPPSSCKANPQPTRRNDLPEKLKRYSRDLHLFGRDELWTHAPREERFVARSGTWIVTKQAWFRLSDGQLALDGRRVDGGVGTFHADLPPMDSYPLDANLHIGPGFIPSSLEFSSAGCWKVIATLGSSRVVLRVDIDASRQGGPR